MEFKSSYFDSGREYDKKKLAYSIRDSLPFHNFITKKSKDNLSLFLNERWKYFKNCKIILDAGCGRGEFLELNPYNLEVYGIDVIKEELEKAKRNGLNVKYADLRKKLPFSDSFFDGVSCSHVLEHLEDGTTAISEFKRILKDKGILLISVPNFSFKRFYTDYTHKRPYPKQALFKLLNDYGFYDIQIFNGACLNQVISGLFFIFPKLRLSIEKFFGLFWPSEFIAVARNKK
jgi:SAM-dependent methyltransferase